MVDDICALRVSSLCCGELLASGACHNLSPHHTTRFCCAAALGARVHRCGNIGTFVIVIILIPTHPYTFYVHRGSYDLTSIFSVVFAKIADGKTADNVWRAKRYRWDHVRARAVSSIYGGELLCLPYHMSCVIVLLLPCSRYVPHHATRAPSRFLAVPKLEFEL